MDKDIDISEIKNTVMYISLTLCKHSVSESLQVLSYVCAWYQDFDPHHPGHWVTVCTSQ